MLIERSKLNFCKLIFFLYPFCFKMGIINFLSFLNHILPIFSCLTFLVLTTDYSVSILNMIVLCDFFTYISCGLFLLVLCTSNTCFLYLKNLCAQQCFQLMAISVLTLFSLLYFVLCFCPMVVPKLLCQMLFLFFVIKCLTQAYANEYSIFLSFFESFIIYLWFLLAPFWFDFDRFLSFMKCLNLICFIYWARLIKVSFVLLKTSVICISFQLQLNNPFSPRSKHVRNHRLLTDGCRNRELFQNELRKFPAWRNATMAISLKNSTRGSYNRETKSVYSASYLPKITEPMKQKRILV